MAAELPKVGDCIAGKYDVEHVLGEGGMGLVYAAMHRELRHRVAVKVLHPQIADHASSAERFRREARAAAAMRGEHICRVLDVGTHDGMPYIVMEYLEGRDLAEELLARGPLPATEAVDYVLQACEALAEAHAAGIVHRDLKPANLFLSTRTDGTGYIKVLDFGVSKSLLGASGQFALTDTSMMVGSPLYMSPEQLDSARDVDHRADIWALGAVLYELLANATPFQGDSIARLVAGVLHDTPKSLELHGVKLPEGLETVVRRSLEKNRDARYPTVGDLANALSPFASSAGNQCAARAVRVLKASGIESGAVSAASSMDAPPPHESSTSGERLSTTKDAESHGGTDARGATVALEPPSKTAGTPLSWDRSSIDAPPRRRRALIGAGLSAVLLAGALSLWLMQSGKSGPPRPATAGQAPAPPGLVQPPGRTAIDLAPSVEPAVAIEPPAGLDPTADALEAVAADVTADLQQGAEAETEADPGAEEEARSDAEPRDEHAENAADAKGRAERKQRRQSARERGNSESAQPASATPAAATPKPEVTTGGITDFGGRR